MTIHRYRIVFTVIGLIFFICGCGIATRYRISGVKAKDINIETPQSALRVGEKFTYKAEWLGMDVGTATLFVKEITEINGHQVYHIVAKAETSQLVSKLYKVEDEMSSYIDTKELYPVRFEKKQREGRHRADEYMDFDQENGKVHYFSRLTNKKKEFNVPKKVHDPLSCIYYFRLQDIQAGESIFANVNLDEKNWFLEAKVINKGIVDIKDLGEWESFMAEPLPWFQGELRRKAKVSIWFSADEKRIPLLVITSGIPFVGTVKITLQKIE